MRKTLPPGSSVTPFIAVPRALWRVIRTTHAFESVLAGLRNIAAGWGRAGRHCKDTMSQFVILGEDRCTRPHA
jgi:hypothetical protein